jgi:c-di-AMP phosphodiesterase-like protein
VGVKLTNTMIVAISVVILAIIAAIVYILVSGHDTNVFIGDLAAFGAVVINIILTLSNKKAIGESQDNVISGINGQLVKAVEDAVAKCLASGAAANATNAAGNLATVNPPKPES